MATRRNYKDSRFRAIFKQKKALLSLYNALSGEGLTDTKLLHINTLKGVLYQTMRNDLSFRVGDRDVVLMEEQSTQNGNMPLRLFLYLAKIYQKQVPNTAFYGSRTQPLPTPHFYVFTLGAKDAPVTCTRRLSEAFTGGSGDLELTVHFYNISYGVSCPLFAKCETLKEYSRFIAEVEQRLEQGLDRDRAIKDTIFYCIKHNILRKFLEIYQAEVYDMTSMKWDLDTALAVTKSEGVEEGEKNGRWKTLVELVRKGYLSIELAAKEAGMSEAEFRKTAML